MDRVMGEAAAVDVVVRPDRHRADDVRRVDVKASPALLLQVSVHRVSQEDADVAVDGVARGVLLSGGHVVLPGTLRDGDDHKVLARQDLVDVFVNVLHFELHLGDQHEVHDSRGQRSVHGDEASVAPHELHDADALVAARGFDPAVADDLRGRRHSAVEAEGLVEEQDVVIDGLWNADDAERQASFFRLRVKHVPSVLGPVAADDEQHVNAHLFDVVANLDRVKASTAGLQDAATLHVDLPH
mmetsp:Transcript_76020/g.211230  ORF Transcript_76020/g.211230 Transcript_76020/m.211230 type:complete len:242 (+) Transcript_76020:228-953(+)